MTQSGQGNEPQLPAAPPARPPQPVREGVVLPAQGDFRPSEAYPHQAAPAGGQAWGQPWGPQGGAPELPPQGGGGAPLPPEGQPYGQQGWSPPQLPPERPAEPPYPNAAEETQLLPPQPAGDAEATQLIPPVPGEAPPPLDTPTTTLAPVKSAPLPPENRPESAAESTTQLRAVRPGRRGAHRQQSAAEETAVLPPTAAAPQIPESSGNGPYAIHPGSPGDRPPPSEFDGLFRDGGGADETQQLPQFGHDDPPPPGGLGGGPGDGGPDGGGGGRRRMSRGMLIGVVVAGCGLVGLAAGAALSTGGDDKGDKGDKKDDTTLSSSSPSAGEPSKSVDPVESQAKALDALLADSNNSRASVIKAVDNIKSCTDLSTAASDLRTAAGQRNDLVTRLGKLSVDKLPNHAQLSAALTKAWNSSAKADNEYATWADQVGGKRGCHKGKARRTPRVGAAERASGEATQAKRTASGLWNPIAGQYGLTKHQATEL